MKNLYDILEVSPKASKEIIEKAYKTLAKKYHPDLQTAENKLQAEEKMKELNEAYSVLMDEQKRKEYDVKLEEDKTQKEVTENIQKQVVEEQINQYYTRLEHKIKLKKFMLIIIFIALLCGFFGILWLIPAAHNWMVSVYNSNLIIRILINIIVRNI